MLKARIIPCLDIDNGRVVKGMNFKNLIDAGDPVNQAKFYSDNHADELCFLDITATYQNRDNIYSMIKKVSEKCFIPFTVGGGIRKSEDIKKILQLGADKVSINSSAILNPDIISESANKFGSQAIVIAIDAKLNKDNEYKTYINGGRKETTWNVIDWALHAEKNGAGEILLTSMDRDGTKSGYDTNLIKLISSKVNIPIIASGGVGKLNHLYDGISSGADAVLAASVFHFGTYSISQAKSYLESRFVPIRKL